MGVAYACKSSSLLPDRISYFFLFPLKWKLLKLFFYFKTQYVCVCRAHNDQHQCTDHGSNPQLYGTLPYHLVLRLKHLKAELKKVTNYKPRLLNCSLGFWCVNSAPPWSPTKSCCPSNPTLPLIGPSPPNDTLPGIMSGPYIPLSIYGFAPMPDVAPAYGLMFSGGKRGLIVFWPKAAPHNSSEVRNANIVRVLKTNTSNLLITRI